MDLETDYQLFAYFEKICQCNPQCAKKVFQYQTDMLLLATTNAIAQYKHFTNAGHTIKGIFI